MKDVEAAGTTCPYCARQNVASNISCAVDSDIYDCDGSCPYCGTTWSFKRIGPFIPMVHKAKLEPNISNCNLEYERKFTSIRRDIDLLSRGIHALDKEVFGQSSCWYGHLRDRIRALEAAEERRAIKDVEARLGGTPLSGNRECGRHG